jgi:hypothetical protein
MFACVKFQLTDVKGQCNRSLKILDDMTSSYASDVFLYYKKMVALCIYHNNTSKLMIALFFHVLTDVNF